MRELGGGTIAVNRCAPGGSRHKRPQPAQTTRFAPRLGLKNGEFRRPRTTSNQVDVESDFESEHV
jgi:hypothetical protein